MDGRHRRVPGHPVPGGVVPERGRPEPRQQHRAAGRQRGKHGGDQAVDVEERHDARRHVVAGQRVSARDRGGRRDQVALPDRHGLRLAGRAAGVQQAGPARPGCRPPPPPGRPRRRCAAALPPCRTRWQEPPTGPPPRRHRPRRRAAAATRAGPRVRRPARPRRARGSAARPPPRWRRPRGTPRSAPGPLAAAIATRSPSRTPSAASRPAARSSARCSPAYDSTAPDSGTTGPDARQTS